MFGKTRELGWVDSIREFGDAWVVTSSPWPLKSQVLSVIFSKSYVHF